MAIKAIRRAARISHGTQPIRREVTALKRAHHVNVISLLEVIDDPGHDKVYLVLEYAEIGHLPWRKKGWEPICQDEWYRVQREMQSREVKDTSPGVQVLEVGKRPSPNRPSTSLPKPSTSKILTQLVSSQQATARRQSPAPADLSNTGSSIHHLEPFTEHFHYVPCITMEQARCAILDIVAGLEYLHAQGIIHRDIKPENLLWTKDYRVKICDFSTCFVGPPWLFTGHSTPANEDLTAFDGAEEMAKTVGTPGFIAPELCCMSLDDMTVQTFQQVDVWSLGATLYCLIFARLPFVANNEYQLYQKMAAQDVYIPRLRLRPVIPPLATAEPTAGSMSQYRKDDVAEYERVDDNLIDLLRSMLTRNPQKRICLVDIKTHAWLAQGSQEHAEENYNTVFPAFW